MAPLQRATLDQPAAAASVRGDDLLAARVWGAATAHREAVGEPRSLGEAAAIDPYLNRSRAALGGKSFHRAATAGAALELETALADALGR
jgi:hypothetical protein